MTILASFDFVLTALNINGADGWLLFRMPDRRPLAAVHQASTLAHALLEGARPRSPPSRLPTGIKLSSLLVNAGQAADVTAPASFATVRIQHLLVSLIEIAKTISLDSIGDDRKQQVPR